MKDKIDLLIVLSASALAVKIDGDRILIVHKKAEKLSIITNNTPALFHLIISLTRQSSAIFRNLPLSPHLTFSPVDTCQKLC